MQLNHIPIVGQVCQVHTGEVSAVVTCNCDSENQPFLIPSSVAAIKCNKCFSVYRIVIVNFDASKSLGVTIGVAQVGKAVPEPAPTVN